MNGQSIVSHLFLNRAKRITSRTIDPYQFGALKGRSTIQQLMVFLHYVLIQKSMPPTKYTGWKNLVNAVKNFFGYVTMTNRWALDNWERCIIISFITNSHLEESVRGSR